MYTVQSFKKNLSSHLIIYFYSFQEVELTHVCITHPTKDKLQTEK